jgi:uncharacterized membrane protein
MTAVALALHIFGAVVWVGGMFAIYVCLRPALSTLEPPQRLRLMRVTLQKFFPWVWLAILLLLASGYWMLFTTFGGFAGAGMYIHLMQMIGWLMIALFVWLFHGPSMSKTGRAPAPSSTASVRSSRSTCRSACSSSSSAAVGATGANSQSDKFMAGPER